MNQIDSVVLATPLLHSSRTVIAIANCSHLNTNETTPALIVTQNVSPDQMSPNG